MSFGCLILTCSVLLHQPLSLIPLLLGAQQRSTFAKCAKVSQLCYVSILLLTQRQCMNYGLARRLKDKAGPPSP